MRLFRKPFILVALLGCFTQDVIADVAKDVLVSKGQETYEVSAMGCQVFWKGFLPKKVLYGRIFPKPTIISVVSTPENSKAPLDTPNPQLSIKGTLEFDVNSITVGSEQDPNEGATWTINLKSDDYLASANFPTISFEISSIKPIIDPKHEESNNSTVEGDLIVFGKKTRIKIPAILGVGGGFVMATTDLELPNGVFSYTPPSNDNSMSQKIFGKKLVGRKVILRITLRAQRKESGQSK